MTLPVSDRAGSGSARLVLAGASVAIFFAAYEVIEPLFAIGPVNFTTSEVAAGLFLVTVLIWAACSRGSFFQRRALDLPVLLFIASCFLSSVFAEDRASALKFTLRLTYAVLLYVGISRLPGKKYKSHLVVAGAITVTLATVVLVGLLETYYLAAHYPQLLSPFQQGVTTFGIFYNVRTTATLSFPTVLSFYLQMTLPLALAFALAMAARRSPARTHLVLGVAVVGTVLVMAVQIYTYTRSGLVSAPLSLLAGAMLAGVFGLGRRALAAFGMGALMIVALVGMMLLTSDKIAVRLGLEEQQEVYTAGYTLVAFPLKIEPGNVYTATIRAYNNSPFKWGVEGSDEVNLSYRWAEYPSMKDLDIVALVNPLPSTVSSGEEVDIEARFQTPSEPGKYILIFELAKAHVGWFSSGGTPPLVIPVEIDANGSRIFGIDEPPQEFTAQSPAEESVSRRKLWQAAVEMWKDNPVIGVGTDQFRFLYGRYVPEVRYDAKLRTHNIFLESLADNGVIGLVVMVYLLVAAAWTQFGLVRDRRQDGVFRVFALALLVVMIAYVMHGMLDWFLWQTGITFMFFILLGLTSWLRAEAGRREG